MGTKERGIRQQKQASEKWKELYEKDVAILHQANIDFNLGKITEEERMAIHEKLRPGFSEISQENIHKTESTYEKKTYSPAPHGTT